MNQRYYDSFTSAVQAAPCLLFSFDQISSN